MLLVRRNSDVPDPLRWSFIHLTGDIFWWGVLNGTSLSFITVYVTRIGGNGFQLGLLAAASAVVNILFAIPIGKWLQTRNTGREVVLFSIYHRIFYLFWIPVPFLLSQDIQIWLLVLLTFLMNIPGVVLQVGFNDLFADAVPPDWRGYVAGIRNAALAIASVLSSIVCGQLLMKVAFPANYQIVFLLGFLGAVIGTIHQYYIWKNLPQKENRRIEKPTPPSIASRTNGIQTIIHMVKEPGNRKFMWMMGGLFGFHFTQYLGIPVFPLYLVNVLKLDDRYISIGNGLFFAVIFVLSTQIPGWAKRFGTKSVVAAGAVCMALYPGILAFSKTGIAYLIGAGLGGFAWALAGGLLYNYLLENIPDGNRPPYLAFYNFVLYSAVLIGSLTGPFLADWLGIANALLLIAFARIVAGILLLRIG